MKWGRLRCGLQFIWVSFYLLAVWAFLVVGFIVTVFVADWLKDVMDVCLDLYHREGEWHGAVEVKAKWFEGRWLLWRKGGSRL